MARLMAVRATVHSADEDAHDFLERVHQVALELRQLHGLLGREYLDQVGGRLGRANKRGLAHQAQELGPGLWRSGGAAWERRRDGT